MKRETIAFYDRFACYELLSDIVCENELRMLLNGRIVVDKKVISRKLGGGYEEVWHVGRLLPDRITPLYRKFHYASLATIEVIDAAINQVSHDYEWAIFPWGTPTEFNLICIYNEDRLLKEIDKPSTFTRMSEYKVSEYECCERIPFHSLVAYENTGHTGRMLWKLYDLETIRPIIATFDLARHDIRGYSDWRLLKPDFIKVGKVNGVDGYKFHLYKPSNVCAFAELCDCASGREFSEDVNELIVFPGYSNHETIEMYVQNLPKLPRSLCSYHKETIGMFDWVYMVDIGDCQTETWLVSRDGMKTREIEKLAGPEISILSTF